jgi:hypothetical protein
MTGRDDFLSRWSRRKREVQKESAKPEEIARVDPAEQVAADETGTVAGKGAEPAEKTKRDEPVFDLSKLPSLESITAETDIRPFLAAGVPASLRQAALRRAWSADPAIRDFIGIAENQWDFTGAGELPGFDFSAPTDEIRRAVAQMFTGSSSGEKQRPRDESGFDIEPPLEVPEVERVREPDQMTVRSESLDRNAASKPQGPTPPLEQFHVSPEKERDVATQNDDAPQNENPKLVVRRSHGGAMPK